MKKLTIKLEGFKVNEDEYGCTITDTSKAITVTVESSKSDAFEENGHPNTDWLEMLAEKQLGHYFEMMSYKILNN
jgi:hypothetical protein